MEALYDGYINNWDIVDVSAPFVVGEHLQTQPRDLLATLAQSSDVWQRRVAMISTFAYLKKGEAATTIKIATILLHDQHDLIQKAVGWMLREMGKKCGKQGLISFLEAHYKTMPRTMLRYAIEHLSLVQRDYFMGRMRQAE